MCFICYETSNSLSALSYFSLRRNMISLLLNNKLCFNER